MENENTYAAELRRAQQEELMRRRQEENKDEEGPDLQQRTGAGDKKYKISFIIGFLMIVTALIVDGLEFVFAAFIITEPIDWIIWIYTVLGFYVWLKMLGISWSDAKGRRALMIFTGGAGLDLIGLGFLPAWTAFVIGTIINDRIEGVIKDSPLAQKAVGIMEKNKTDKEREDKRKEEKYKQETEKKR